MCSNTSRCAKNQLVTRHKRVVRVTTGLLSSDWSKITFIFRIRSVAGLCRGQRYVSLKKKMRNVLFQKITYVLLVWNLSTIHCDSPETHITMCDPYVAHLWSICNPFYDLWTTHLWFICNLSKTHLLPICNIFHDSYVIHPMTHTWCTC